MSDNPLKNRINEKDVASILALISDTPNRRGHSMASDLAGKYDFWFDGGACRVHTGSLEYVFSNGTRALVGAPIPWLSVTIEYSDGRRVTIKQERT